MARSIAIGSAVAALGALILTACGGTAPAPPPTATPSAPVIASVAPTPSPTLPSTPAPSPSQSASSTAGPLGTFATGRVEAPELGIAITLADGWSSIPLGAGDLQERISAAIGSTSLGQSILGQAAQMALRGVKLWAFDLRPASIATGFAPNVNVIPQADAGTSIELVTGATVAQLKTVPGVSDVTADTVALPIGTAGHVTYRVALTGESGATATVVGAQYYVTVAPNILIFTFSCGATDPNACQADTQTMIQSVAALH